MSDPVDDQDAPPAPAVPSGEAPAASPRIRAKVRSPRDLRRDVFRNSLEARGNEKVASSLRTERPVTRGDCAGGQRPCPWVGCKHHLYLDVNPETGSIRINFPDLEPWEMEHTCSLDVAELGGVTLERVGELIDVTRERVRQVETKALLLLKSHPRSGGLR